MLKYCLIKTPITKDEQYFVAHSSSSKTVTLDDYLKDIVDEGTGLTRPQALAYFEKMTQLTKGYLEQGYFVSTPLFRFRSSISGKFDSRVDRFDAERHTIKITSTPGTKIRDIDLVPLPNKIFAAEISPTIDTFVDSITDARNSTGTAGDLAVINGSHLKFDKKDPIQGVFFLSVENPLNEYRTVKYSVIKAGLISFAVPQLEKGAYKVVVRNMDRNNKKMVTGTLNKIITF